MHVRAHGSVELVAAHAEVGRCILGSDESRDKRRLSPTWFRREKGGHRFTSRHSAQNVGCMLRPGPDLMSPALGKEGVSGRVLSAVA